MDPARCCPDYNVEMEMEQPPLSFKRQQAKLKMSPISILARAVLIGYFVYVVWSWVASS